MMDATTQIQHEKIKASLFDFIVRVSSGNRETTAAEVEVLPSVVNIWLERYC